MVKTAGIPEKIGAYPINDPDGFYIGFAGSGYGIMWNTRYLEAKNIPVPREWEDLKKPVYHGHVGMSAPSRSGTTHLTVKTVLQGEGWDKGWATWKEMAGNFNTDFRSTANSKYKSSPTRHSGGGNTSPPAAEE